MENKKLDHQVEIENEKLKIEIKNLKNDIHALTSQVQKFAIIGEQANRLNALHDFAAGLGHEINNPLSMLQFRFQKIKKIISNENLSREEMGSEISQEIMKLQSITERIANVVRSLRDFTKDGQNEPIDLVNIHSIIESVMNITLERFKQDNIKITFDNVPKDLILECRTGGLTQIIMNLISNSADAIRGTQEPWIDIMAKESDDLVFISITDSGLGIEEKNIHRLFEPFYTTKPPGSGMGLGLSVVFGIVADHHGKIYYDKNCQNTRFTIELPKRQKKTKLVITKALE